VKRRGRAADERVVHLGSSPAPFPLAVVAAAATLPAALLATVGHSHVGVSGETHLIGVGATAAVATVAALALTAVGARRRDGRTVLLGTAFTAMAGLLAVHGLTTPGFLVGMNGVVAFSGAATLPVGGLLMALSALPPLRRPRAVGRLVALQVALLCGLLGLGATGIAFPALVPSVPEPAGTMALATLAAGLGVFAVVGTRALRAYRLTRRPADLVVVVGIAWLALALVPALTLDFRELGWWLGHAFELVGIGLVGAPLAVDLSRDAPTRALAGGPAAAHLVTAEQEFLGSHVRALTRLLAERDTYTEEHTRRVALLAVQVGETLGLSPERLRVLAAGGLLHDIGKLAVPDAILAKPGALTDAEYTAIKEHPLRGDELLAELGGFPDEVRRLVTTHHERLDGSGYPWGLRADALALETRILAVCDVYDALRSTRVYRDAWPHERARALLRQAAGREFDERCVAALERVVEGERAGGELPVAV
jgi:putative nucleotidyltransferase with HDIG domain